MADIKFNREKLRELVLYVGEREFRDPKFGKVKLLKLVWLSDFLAYAKLGEPITGATYIHLDHGPGPKELPALLDEMSSQGEANFFPVDYYGRKQDRLLAHRPPNLSVFSPQEVAVIDDVIAMVWDYNAVDISSLSHKMGLGFGWRLTTSGQEIPYESVFVSDDPLTDRDIERGQEVAKHHGWLATGTDG